jgi:hypothetical protein
MSMPIRPAAVFIHELQIRTVTIEIQSGVVPANVSFVGVQKHQWPRIISNTHDGAELIDRNGTDLGQKSGDASMMRPSHATVLGM